MKMTTFFPFCDKTYPKGYMFLLFITFIIEGAVITILNMILSTILLLYLFIVLILLLALANIYTNGK